VHHHVCRCKFGKAPWWPALVAEPATAPQVRDAGREAALRGASVFLIFYPYMDECSYACLRPSLVRHFDPFDLSLAASAGGGGVRSAYSQKCQEWGRAKLAQALADATAESLNSIPPPSLRQLFARRNQMAPPHRRVGAEESQAWSAARLRAELLRQSQNNRGRLFGDARLGSLPVSVANDPLPGGDNGHDGGSGGHTARGRGAAAQDEKDKQPPPLNTDTPPRPGHQADDSPAAAQQQQQRPGRLSDHARQRMRPILELWCGRHPLQSMPSKEEKLRLAASCTAAAGTDVCVRTIEYFFWGRNKRRRKGGSKEAPPLAPPAAPQRTTTHQLSHGCRAATDDGARHTLKDDGGGSGAPTAVDSGPQRMRWDKRVQATAQRYRQHVLLQQQQPPPPPQRLTTATSDLPSGDGDGTASSSSSSAAAAAAACPPHTSIGSGSGGSEISKLFLAPVGGAAAAVHAAAGQQQRASLRERPLHLEVPMAIVHCDSDSDDGEGGHEGQSSSSSSVVAAPGPPGSSGGSSSPSSSPQSAPGDLTLCPPYVEIEGYEQTLQRAYQVFLQRHCDDDEPHASPPPPQAAATAQSHQEHNAGEQGSVESGRPAQVCDSGTHDQGDVSQPEFDGGGDDDNAAADTIETLVEGLQSCYRRLSGQSPKGRSCRQPRWLLVSLKHVMPIAEWQQWRQRVDGVVPPPMPPPPPPPGATAVSSSRRSAAADDDDDHEPRAERPAGSVVVSADPAVDEQPPRGSATDGGPPNTAMAAVATAQPTSAAVLAPAVTDTDAQMARDLHHQLNSPCAIGRRIRHRPAAPQQQAVSGAAAAAAAAAAAETPHDSCPAQKKKTEEDEPTASSGSVDDTRPTANAAASANAADTVRVDPTTAPSASGANKRPLVAHCSLAPRGGLADPPTAHPRLYALGYIPAQPSDQQGGGQPPIKRPRLCPVE
jgi:hypothetical protein